MEERKIGLELHSLNHLIRRYIDFSSHKKEIMAVTGNNGWIIGFLAENAHRDIYQKDLEDHFTIARSTASRVLGRMEDIGMIERWPVSHDARLKKIVLTEKAAKLGTLMREDHDKIERILMRGFGEDEAETLYSYILRMKDNITDQVPTP